MGALPFTSTRRVGNARPRIVQAFVVLLACFASVPSEAGPSLDPARHPYIALISTDQASYQPSAQAHVLLSLRNPSEAGFAGRVTTSLFRNERQILQDSQAVSMPPRGRTSLAIAMAVPPSDLRGYRVEVVVEAPEGKAVDRGFGSLDVETGALPSRFPRQCWVSKWGPDVDPASLTDSLVAWRCNIIQGYANYYRPELAPPAALQAWPSLPNKPVGRPMIEAVIAAAHVRRLPVLFFQATGEAYDDFLERRTGPKLEEGSFVRPCSTTKPCGEADLDRSPRAPDNWSQYGWQTDHLDLFDTCSHGWQKQLLSKSIKPMLVQFAFDSWQADTLGPPNGDRYDFKGRLHDPGACLSRFTSDAQHVLDAPVVVNNVSGWHGDITALAGAQPMIYRETWNFDTPTYAGLDALTDGSQGGLRRYTARPIIQPAYLQRALSKRCDTSPSDLSCRVNMSSPLLATAMYAIAGSTFMNHMDDGCLATGVFMEGYHLPCPAAVEDALLTYKNFEVAYQPMLRDGVTPSAEPCVVTSGVVAGTTGTAGQAYVLGRTKAGFQICQFLNLTGIPTDHWTDLDGTMPSPVEGHDIGGKLYYVGSPVTPGTNRLWWASPDANNGAAVELPYTVGTDATGAFVAFTLPSLSYWSMAVLETNTLADDDFHINPYALVRGANFTEASNGIGSARTVTIGSCCGRWARYAGLDFGPVSPADIHLLYGSSRRTSILVRLDDRHGPVVGGCSLQATGGPGARQDKRCAIHKAIGRHDVVLVFHGAGASLYNFEFER